MSHSLTNSFPTSFVDENNSTTATLGVSGTWTGTATNISAYDSVVFFMSSDVDGTLTAEFSPDGTNWDLSLSFEYDASEINPPNRLTCIDKFYRLSYANGSTGQAHFRLQSVVKTSAALLSTPLTIAVPKDADATVSRVIGEEISTAEGKFAGRSIINKFGINSDIDTTTDPETIWGGGGIYTGHPVSTSETVDVRSSDTNDTSAGTGARTLFIEGLDANWAVQSETITMNGTSDVVSSGTYRRVNRAYVVTAGSGGENAGAITIEHTTTSANVFAVIPATKNQTQICAYTVPANHKAYIKQVQVSVFKSNSSNITGTLKTRATGTTDSVFRIRDNFSASDSDSYQTEYYGGIECDEKTDIRVDIDTVSANNTEVAGRMDIVLIEQ